MERVYGSQTLVLSGFPGGGSNSFLDIQGIEAYRGLINKNDTQKCAALLCSFKKKHFNHNKNELVSSLLQCKVERNKCSKADLTALSPDGKPPLKLGLPRKGGLVHPSRAREYAETQMKKRASSALSQRMSKIMYTKAAFYIQKDKKN